MGDVAFPAHLKPIVNLGYGWERGSNLLATPVQGGLARSALNYSRESVPFNVTVRTDENGVQAFFDWFDGPSGTGINHGADTFPMKLKSGTGGITEHQCLFDPKTKIRVRSRDDVNFSITFKVFAEVTPDQSNPFGGDLYAIYQELGDDTAETLRLLEELANITFPTKFPT